MYFLTKETDRGFPCTNFDQECCSVEADCSLPLALFRVKYATSLLGRNLHLAFVVRMTSSLDSYHNFPAETTQCTAIMGLAQ